MDRLMFCKNAATSEEYQSFLINFLFDNDTFFQEYPDACLYTLGYGLSVIYINGMLPLMGANRNLQYNMIPKCYGLMTSKELEVTGVNRIRTYPGLALRGSGTLIAIIDTGVNVKDPLLRYETGETKIKSFWDQTGENEMPDDRIFFGKEWTEEALNQLLIGEEDKHGSLPTDEDGHGTFLACIAGGREEEESGFSGVAPDSEMIVVKLKQAKNYLKDFYGIDRSVWACEEDDVILALKYVVEKAREWGRPISICLGIGTSYGGHRGTNYLERYMESLSTYPGVSIHVAGGDEGIAGHHVRRVEATGLVEMNVGNGEESFIVEFWGKEPSNYSIGIQSPGGEKIDRIQLQPGEYRELRFVPENTILSVRSFPREIITGDQVIRMKFQKLVPGIWKFFIYNNLALANVSSGGEVGIGGFGSGLESSLSGISWLEYDMWLPIKNFLKEDTFFLSASPNVTITSPGNARYAMTYTAYDVDTGGLYIEAGRGYTADDRIVPDFAAPGVAVAVPILTDPLRRKEIRSKVRSGSSIASAFGAGIGALMQEWAIVKENDPLLNGQNLRSYLIQGAVRTSPYRFPNQEWGYGLVNIYDTFLSLRG